MRHALACANADAHIVAIDGTRRPRPDGLTLKETVDGIHAGSNALVVADCGSLDDAAAAVVAGADLVATTLAGYTGERNKTLGPDLQLIEDIVAADLGRPHPNPG